MIKDTYYSVSQSAKVLGVSRMTIWRWLRGGRLNAERVGRKALIPRTEVNSLRCPICGHIRTSEDARKEKTLIELVAPKVFENIEFEGVNLQGPGRIVFIPEGGH